MTQNSRGFTLVEVTVVVVLIGIIAAVVFARSISTDQLNVVGQVDKIRNHIRFAQSMALKRLDMNSDERWGIKCLGGQYWLFTYENIADENTPIMLPGAKNEKISLSDLGITMIGYTLFFDGLGVPYKESPTSQLADPFNIKITASTDTSQSRTLTVTPETGFITTQ